MRLYLVRHAEAEPGEPDELRRLTPEGKQQARTLGERLRNEGVKPDAILTSPLLRARETGDELAMALGTNPETDERLAPGADAAGLRAAVSGRGEHVVAVGHAPDCAQIAAELTGGPEPSFPAGGHAVVDLD
ncbi:MAG TPA: phosphohistidine phosphatase SixA [Gaiellaceae bacterium]|jgi:phosphohistidine phosphatase|nr:phosphohistidine phosphatase SixA [Gaiellaceae bacterium]